MVAEAQANNNTTQQLQVFDLSTPFQSKPKPHMNSKKAELPPLKLSFKKKGGELATEIALVKKVQNLLKPK